MSVVPGQPWQWWLCYREHDHGTLKVMNPQSLRTHGLCNSQAARSQLEKEGTLFTRIITLERQVQLAVACGANAGQPSGLGETLPTKKVTQIIKRARLKRSTQSCIVTFHQSKDTTPSTLAYTPEPDTASSSSVLWLFSPPPTPCSPTLPPSL